jgi:uncharacterized repeat protein (TIGR01451 family)
MFYQNIKNSSFMWKFRHIFQCVFLLLTGLFISNPSIGQTDCLCDPQISITVEQCAEQGKETEIGYYIYSQNLGDKTIPRWIKIFADGKLIADKEIFMLESGYFSEVIKVKPEKDTKYYIEFHCVKNKCISSKEETLTTMPFYDIAKKDISCHGASDGEVKLLPESMHEIDLVWQTGEKKNLVKQMHAGLYAVTVQHANGCKENLTLQVNEPNKLELNPHSFTIETNNGNTDYVKLDISGGSNPYFIDWDIDGLGDKDDTDKIIVQKNKVYVVSITDQNGCTAKDQVSFRQPKSLKFDPKNGKVIAEKELDNGQYLFNLTKTLDPAYGDNDGDGLKGSVFDVEFYAGSTKIENPENYKGKINEIVLLKSANDPRINNVSNLLLTTDFFIIQNNGSTACDYFNPIEIVATTVDNQPLPPNGKYRVFERSSGTEYTDSVLIYNPLTLKWSWDPGFDPPNSPSPLRYIIYYIAGTDTLQSQLNVVSPSGSVDVLVSDVCGNSGRVSVLCSPEDGILSGPGIVTGSLIFPGSDQIIYLIDPSKLAPGATYSYTYSIPQSTGTASGLRCAAIITDTLRVLPYPSITINEFDSQVCKKEEIRLAATSVPSPGNINVAYQWFFKPSGSTKLDTLVNTNNNLLTIPEAEKSGEYIVKVTQSNGCMARDTGVVSVINLPEVNSEVLTSSNCFGVSSAIVNVKLEGVTVDQANTYTYDWLGKYTGTIRTGKYQENLPADSFFITVTTPPLNIRGLVCSIVDTVVITSHPSIGIDCSPKDTTLACFGLNNMVRTISVSPTAKGPFGYSLISKDGPFQTSNTFSGLGVGTDPAILSKDFKVYVRDFNGCVDSCEFTIKQPLPLQCSIQKSDLTCFNGGNGTVTATVTGGTLPYRYVWSNRTDTIGPTFSTTSTINGLNVGAYKVTIIDANGCLTTCNISVDQPAPIVSNLTKDTICLNFDGVVSANPTGGSAPYTYQWHLLQAGTTGAVDTNLIGQTNTSIQNFSAWCLKPGTVKLEVVITDKNNCVLTDSTTLLLQPCFDLALRKTVTHPQQYYPGDKVEFSIEVFNQGTVDATDVTIKDSLDVNMRFELSDNTSAKTGNEEDWVSNTNGILETSISRLNAGAKKTIKVFLIIKDITTSNYMINYANISDASAYIGLNKIKEDPIDEDDFVPTSLTPQSEERDDEICDTDNVPFGECTMGDDPTDEDKLDFAIVSICQLEGAKLQKSECTTGERVTSGFVVNNPEYKDLLDPTGDGDGDPTDGDSGNVVLSFHNSMEDAMKGSRPITGSIKFAKGSGGQNSSNGIVTGDGDLLIFADQEITIFGRLEDIEGCIGTSSLEINFDVQPIVEEQPQNTRVISDQENVCLHVATDNLGVSLNYQWQQLTNGVFVDIPNATESEYCIDKVTNEMDGTQYRVLITDASADNRQCATYSAAAIIELEGDPELVCNDLVNISLDDNCQVLITPDMILEDSRFENRIDIIIKDANGAIVQNPMSSANVGKTYTVTALDSGTGNSCWSKIKIEDKLPPVIQCPLDYTINCANYTFNPPTPLFADACDANATITLVKDEFSDLACNRTDGFIAVRTLTYVAKDSYGNTSPPCTFKVYYQKINITLTNWPNNLELSCFSPNQHASWDVNGNDYPDPAEAGVPSINGFPLVKTYFEHPKVVTSDTYCKVNVTFSYEKIALCGNSFKILRLWTVVDWCNGRIEKHHQIISVKDNTGPVVNCLADQAIVISTLRNSCVGNLKVPAPTITFDCNNTSWNVSYLADDQDIVNYTTGLYITDNVVFDGKDYQINNLKSGIHWIRYSIIDACDNLSYCYRKIEVRDIEKPTPVCDEVTVISLDAQGNARLFAKTIDDGSHDNCSKVTFGLRRMTNSCTISPDAQIVSYYNGIPYYNFVDFCCADQTDNVQQVELLVIDESGNKNTCMTTVQVQQKILPIIHCPADVTLDCGSGYSPEELNKIGTFTSACPLYYITYADSVVEKSCSTKDIFRTWAVKTIGSNQTVVSCTQRIYIRNLTPFKLNTVVFPANVTLTNQCNTVKDFGPTNAATGGFPTWNNEGCSQIAASYIDQVFEKVEDACFKIVRHWTVIDWCTFDAENQATIRNHQQIIKVIDTEKPKAICTTVYEDVNDGCVKNVTIEGKGEDTCTPEKDLKYSYSLNGNEAIASKFLHQNLPVGIHTITWTVADKCSNTASCSQIVHVRDVKKPTPYCLSEIATVLMPSSLSVAVWAKDYDRGAKDNCTQNLRFTFGPNAPISFTRKHYYKQVNGNSIETTESEYLNGEAECWDPATNTSGRIFDCLDLGINDVDIYVWDDAGNSDYCKVKIKIQDNSGNCGLSRTAVSSGNVHSMKGNPLNHVTMTYTDMDSHETSSMMANGTYKKEGLINDKTYQLNAAKDDDYLNGVSTLDLVLIQKHILGVEPITDKYLQIAADVNNDKKITASDILELRKLILGQTIKFAKNNSWKLIVDQPVNDFYTAWEMQENATFTTQANKESINHFKGIKIGDINKSATENIGQPNVETRSKPLYVHMVDRNIQEGAIERVEVKAGDLRSLLGLQFALNMDKSLEIRDVIPGALPVTESNYHISTSAQNNSLNFSWNSNDLTNFKESDVLFTLVISNSDKTMSMKDGIKLSVINQGNEVIGNGYQVNDFGLKFIGNQSNTLTNQMMVHQNLPNPFTEMTVIKYYLPKGDMLDVSVTDIDGRSVFNKKERKTAGTHEQLISKSMLGNQSGVFLVTFKTTEESQTIKIILTE